MGNLVLSPAEQGQFSIMQASCKKPKNKFETGSNVNDRYNWKKDKNLSSHEFFIIHLLIFEYHQKATNAIHADI